MGFLGKLVKVIYNIIKNGGLNTHERKETERMLRFIIGFDFSYTYRRFMVSVDIDQVLELSIFVQSLNPQN